MRRSSKVTSFILAIEFTVALSQLSTAAAATNGINGTISSTVSVKNFGARGNGITDDTNSIQSAINTVENKGGGIVTIPSGVYMIDATRSVHLASNITLQLASDAKLEAIPNAQRLYAVLDVEGVQNVSISGGIIQGDRNTHLGTSGEWGMGISVEGSSSISISNTKIQNCWGDGVYIGTDRFGYDRNVVISDVTVDNNRRNGISVISGQNIQITNCVATHSQGTAPGDGVDIEPNTQSEVLDGITVSHLTTANDNGAGLQLCLANLNSSSQIVSIIVDNHRDNGSAIGFEVTKSMVGGTVNVHDSSWNDNPNGAVVVYDMRSEINNHISAHADLDFLVSGNNPFHT